MQMSAVQAVKTWSSATAKQIDSTSASKATAQHENGISETSHMVAHQDGAIRGTESTLDFQRLTKANLKELRQVRRGLRKARFALAQSPIQADASRQKGEELGRYLARKIRRDAIVHENQTGGFCSDDAQQAAWRVHLSMQEPDSIVGTPARHRVRRQFSDDLASTRQELHQLGSLDATDLHVRICTAIADAQGDKSVGTPASTDWRAGDCAETLVNGEWNRVKIVGSAEKFGELTVMVTEGKIAGDFLDVSEQNMRFSRSKMDTSVRLDQARQAYADIIAAVAQSNIDNQDRTRLNLELCRLRDEISALEYAEQHGRRDVPLEVSRFVRLRLGILQRGRKRRQHQRRYPPCARCGIQARGSEDQSNGAWYCRKCWVEWESSWHVGTDHARTRRLGAGSWISSGCDRRLAEAGAQIVDQRRQIDSLQAQLSSLVDFSDEIQLAHVEREELFGMCVTAPDTCSALAKIRDDSESNRRMLSNREATRDTELPKLTPSRPPVVARRKSFPVPTADTEAGLTDEARKHLAPLPESSLRTALLRSSDLQRQRT